MRKFLSLLGRVLGSYTLAIAVLFLLFVLTLVGTLEQTRLGLFEVQQRYFNSAVAWIHLPWGGLKVPLPGVYLLLVVFTINLIVGGLARARWSWNRAGILTVHGGMLLMLAAGLVTHHFAREGRMTLHEGESSRYFSSYHDWELVIAAADAASGLATEYVIGQEEFTNLTGARACRFEHAGLPFTVRVSHYARNALVRPVDAQTPPAATQAGEFYIAPLPPDLQNEANLPAVQIELEAGGSQPGGPQILWGNSELPLSLDVNGQIWDFYLRQRRWEVPFEITLTKFTHEYYPGTQIPKTYESDIIKTEQGARQAINIRMNQPLRHRGYTFFQASFNDDPNTGLVSSTFAVVQNPSDQWPLISCVIVSLGLLLHFALHLGRYLSAQKKGGRA